jgi:hypothetical protein
LLLQFVVENFAFLNYIILTFCCCSTEGTVYCFGFSAPRGSKWIFLSTIVFGVPPTLPTMTVLWRTIAVVLFLFRNVEAFLPSSTTSSRRVAFVRLHAGGFEWEDPQNAFDQGVDNPFKNPNLTGGPDGMKIDPARLLGPRLSGSNVYLIGMMGSGKTAVGDLMARREFLY